MVVDRFGAFRWLCGVPCSLAAVGRAMRHCTVLVRLRWVVLVLRLVGEVADLKSRL